MSKGALPEKDIPFLCLRTVKLMWERDAEPFQRIIFLDFPIFFHLATDPLQSPSLLYQLLNFRDGTSNTENPTRISVGIQVGFKGTHGRNLCKEPVMTQPQTSCQKAEGRCHTHLSDLRKKKDSPTW